MITAKSFFDGGKRSYEELLSEGMMYALYFSRAEAERFFGMNEDEAHELAVRELGALVLEGACQKQCWELEVL